MANPYASVTKIRHSSPTDAGLALREAFVQLAWEKDVEKITVKELCATAYVARSTFYSLYKNTDELLAEIEDDLVYDLHQQNRQLMARGQNEVSDLRYYDQTLEYVSDNAILFELLLVRQPRQRFVDRWKLAIKHHVWERLFSNRMHANADLALELAASSVISFYKYWLQHPQNVNTDDLYPIISAILKVLDSSER